MPASARSTRTAAIQAPGVLGVFTAADLAKDGIGRIPCVVPLKNRDGSPVVLVEHPLLAEGKARHVGDGIAFIVAETLSEAKDAAELIDVDYETLPAAVETAAANAPGQPLVWDEIPGNLCFDWESGNRKAVEAGFAKAKHVVAVDAHQQPPGRQFDGAARRAGNLRSGRGAFHAHHLDPGLARHPPAAGRERFQAAGEPLPRGDARRGRRLRHEAVPLSRAGAGAVRGAQARAPGANGPASAANPSSPTRMAATTSPARVSRSTASSTSSRSRSIPPPISGPISRISAPSSRPWPAPRCSRAVYRTPAAIVRVKGVYTNTVPVDAYRGAGRPEANYVIERLVDHAARQLKLAPAELRRRNFIPPEAYALQDRLGSHLRQRRFRRRTWTMRSRPPTSQGFPARRAAANARGRLLRLRHRHLYRAMRRRLRRDGGDPFRCRAAPSPVIVGSQSSGQGHQTAYAQLAADGLGVPVRSRARASKATPTSSASAAAPAARVRCRWAASRSTLAVKRIIDKGTQDRRAPAGSRRGRSRIRRRNSTSWPAPTSASP